MHLRFCTWQARLEITVAYSLDASQITARGPEGSILRDEHGRALKAVGRAAVRHDGAVIAGRLGDTVRLNNYTGEMAAHLDAGRDAIYGYEPELRHRVAFVFDATSPVSAEAKFHKVHDRRKSKGITAVNTWIRGDESWRRTMWRCSFGRHRMLVTPLTSGRTWRLALPRALKRCCRSSCERLATSRCGRLARCARGKRLVGHGWGGSCPVGFRRA